MRTFRKKTFLGHIVGPGRFRKSRQKSINFSMNSED